MLRQRAKHRDVAELMLTLQSRHPKQVDPGSVLLKPIGDFVEQSRIMPREYRED